MSLFNQGNTKHCCATNTLLICWIEMQMDKLQMCAGANELRAQGSVCVRVCVQSVIGIN